MGLNYVFSLLQKRSMNSLISGGISPGGGFQLDLKYNFDGQLKKLLSFSPAKNVSNVCLDIVMQVWQICLT